MSVIDIKIAQQLGDFVLDVAFSTGAGVTAIFGPSGSGKTSAINAIAGLGPPADGRIAVGDRVLLDSEQGISVPPHKRKIGYVFQDARLFPHLSVRANLDYGARAGVDADLFDKLVAILGLDPLLPRRPAHLSGGEAQRVAIARALLSAPDILLMDEPLSALDQSRKDEFLPYLERLRDHADLPIFYVSHALEEVTRLASEIVILRDGRVVQSGALAPMLTDPTVIRDLGIRQAGALLNATLIRQDAGDGLSELKTSVGRLFLPSVTQPEGTRVKVRILASDIILSTDEPVGLSALNILPCTVNDIVEGQGPGAAIGLNSGDDRLVARITRRSARAMELKPGSAIFAIIKSVSVAPNNVTVLEDR